jgi:LacI family transcriptional regulator
MKTAAATMREVAQRAKVSTSTVSLALRNSPLVARETRTRISELADKLGYKIHPLVAAHMRSRRKPQAGVRAPVIALMDAQRVRHGWRDNPYTMLRAMFVGAEAQAQARGYQTRSFWLHEAGMSHARLSEMLRARGILGVVIGPSSDLQLQLDLRWEWFSVVRLGSARVTPMVHRVVIDHYQAGMLAAQKAHELGFRRPGLTVREPFGVAHDWRYEAGYQTACAHLPGMRPVPSLFTPEVPDRSTLLRWIGRHRPDVILDAEEYHDLHLLRAEGWRVPEDIAILSLCAPRPGDPLSGCVQDGQTIGSAGIDYLVAMIERNETGLPTVPVTLSAGVTWNPGETLRPTAGDAAIPPL